MGHYGLRATTLVWAHGPAGATAIGMPYFWQNCPKAVAADREGLLLSLFPAHYGDSHELQAGEQKTHGFRGRSAGRFRPRAVRSLRQPASATPAGLVFTRAVPYCAGGRRPNPAYWRSSVRRSTPRPPRGQARADRRMAGGTSATSTPITRRSPDRPEPLVSLQQQYDAVAGAACQFMRTGDRRWLTAMDELASHVVDIDLITRRRQGA